MRFGLFYQLPCADTQTQTTRYQETIEQIIHAEQLGFDCAWLAELHFYKHFSIMSSPLIVATAIAQQTERIRPGHCRQPPAALAPGPQRGRGCNGRSVE